MDEAGLGFERLPHVGVKGPFRDVAEDLSLFVRVALAQDATFPLLDISGPPRRVQVMERHQPPLNIRAGAHLLGRSEQHPDPPRVHCIEEQFLGGIRLGVVDKRDLITGDACFHKLRTDIVVNVESSGIGRRKVAENELRRALGLRSVPNLDDAGNGEINLGFLVRLRLQDR